MKRGARESMEERTMKTISICNQKGGVGKTTTSLCLSAGLTEKGYKVLLVDAEGQRNATATVGSLHSEQPTLLEVLTGTATAKQAIIETPTGDLISGNKRLNVIDDLLDDERRYTALRDALKAVRRQYDFCIVDTPPSLSTLTLSALTASDYIIIPCLADLYSSYGLVDLAETVQAVRSMTNSKLKVLGVLLTQHSQRTKLSKEMTETLEQLTETFDTTLFDTSIRTSIKAREAQFKPQGLLKYAPRNTVAQDYRAFTEEVLHRLE